MKLWEIFRFEIVQQSRRVSTWLYFAVVLGFTYMMVTEGYVDNTRNDGHFLNAPFVIASVATIGSMIGLLITASLAGDAGARDVQTRMHPLLYTTPVGKGAYLNGRFLAAFVLNLLILVAVPAGLVLAALPLGSGPISSGRSGPLPTSLDLYRELQAVTPASLRYLLADLFEANTYWGLAAERVTARQAESGSWGVTLDVEARKVVVDSVGNETEVPMDDLVEVGVFKVAEDGGLGDPLYMRMHRVRSGEQQITVTVPGKPAGAGIDPRSLLIDVDATDNLQEVGG